jgi:hypothetical protein
MKRSLATPVEELLGRGLESQERQLLRRQFLSAHRARLERVQPVEDLHRARPESNWFYPSCATHDG